MKNILLAGGTGLIGQELIKVLIEKKYSVTILSRKKILSDTPGVDCEIWDGRNIPDLKKDFYAIINLSGAPLADHSWNKNFRKIIMRSRIDSTRAMADFIIHSTTKPSVIINASAVGIYGNRPDETLTESSVAGTGFLSDVVSEWENAARDADIRTVLLRTGVVLSRRGGALPRLVAPLRMGFSVWFGHGRQHLPWIHIDDEVAAILFCLENETISGPVNLASPQGATGREAARRLRIAKHGCLSLPVPALIIKLIMGQRASLLLDDQSVIPEKLINAGFKFRFEKMEDALKEIFSDQKK
ncbi:MAG: TIGR01777 family oxidoreductase [Bacteroidota bacterium]